uniref:Uncharacterized protein n=1 Tax=Romanomermis culicivorax TaxID=13658 RepID=A0A915I4S7_ROMCU
MVRFGMLAVQLLPENTSAGMIFFTDGVLGVPDVSLLDTLLTQLRIWTIGCTFVLVQSNGSKPDCAFTKVSNIEFMRFLAAATFGGYMEQCPELQPGTAINIFHENLLCWNFQRVVKMTDWIGENCKVESCLFHFSPIRYKHYSSVLSTTLTSLLSVRLREGYTLKSCSIADSKININLILPWKNQICMEYVVVSDWPQKSK